jgi:hypothetical protein
MVRSRRPDFESSANDYASLDVIADAVVGACAAPIVARQRRADTCV